MQFRGCPECRKRACELLSCDGRLGVIVEFVYEDARYVNPIPGPSRKPLYGHLPDSLAGRFLETRNWSDLDCERIASWLGMCHEYMFGIEFNEDGKRIRNAFGVRTENGPYVYRAD